MIETIVSQAIGLGSAATAGAPAAAPGLSDVERFQLAMNQPPGTMQAFAQVAPSSPSPDAGATVRPSTDGSGAAPSPRKTVGDAILSGLQSASQDLSQSWTGATAALSQSELTVADVLRWQQVLLQSSIQYELLGKVISKSTQNLDHVLKTQ